MRPDIPIAWSSPRWRIAIAHALLHTVLLVLGASSAPAQEAGTASDTAAKPAKAAVETISIAEIGTASERAKRILAEIESALAPEEETAQAAAAVPALSDRVEDLISRSQRARTAEASTFNLDRLQREWNSLGADLSAIQSKLDTRSKQIEEQIKRIRKERSIWQATREVAIAQDVSPEVIDQIGEVEAAGRAAADTANDRQAAVVRLQSDVASLSEKMKSELKAIADSRNALVGLVFQRDSLPMWSLEFWDPMSAAEIQAQLVDHEKREQLLLSEYWDDNRSGVVTYLVLSALLGVALIASRDRVHKKLAGDDLAPIRAIFDRPISLAMLISFFVALFTIPEIGRVLAPVLGAASLIPAVLILRQIVDRPLFPLLNLVVGVYFIHQLREIISPLLGLYRLTFTAETLILLLVCGWWLRPSRLRDIPREMARSWLFRC
ncbi:MAG: hypothetical protein JRE70_21510, partial [Deltaproteobacteria bacterium]|nr:hypothetical protein [Deltaproteobacteria bacterium]